MVKGVRDVLLPSVLAVMMMCPVVPSSAARGIPLSAPVVVSNLIHAGCPDMVNPTTALPGETEGWNEYWVPTVALSGGAPCKANTVERVDADPLDGVVGLVMTPETDAPPPAAVFVLLPVAVPVLPVLPVAVPVPLPVAVPVLLPVAGPVLRVVVPALPVVVPALPVVVPALPVVVPVLPVVVPVPPVVVPMLPVVVPALPVVAPVLPVVVPALPVVSSVPLAEEEPPCVPEQPPIISTTISHSASRALAASNSRPCIPPLRSEHP
jgi:hypothetical protein